MPLKYVLQDKFYKQPNEDSRGNCQQAAVASLLGLELHEVPNFSEAEDFWGSFRSYMKSLGLSVIALPGNLYLDVDHLAYGQSARGVRHACVYRRGKLVWDPHPSGRGLESVDEINLVIARDLVVKASQNEAVPGANDRPSGPEDQLCLKPSS